MTTKVLGGWSMSLTRYPFDEFNYIMYGMVTNLQGLTAGTLANPGWSPANEFKPNTNRAFIGKRLWVYGGGGCAPENSPANVEAVSRIVAATIDRHWDGVDFDDECSMNTSLVIEAMKRLKESDKEVSFGFTAGYSYNHPTSDKGKALSDKIKAIITADYCDRLIHYCYAAAMWNQNEIIANVKPALERTIAYGMDSEKIILALTSQGLTQWSLNYYLDQVIDLNLGGLFIWRYDEITPAHLSFIKTRLNK